MSQETKIYGVQVFDANGRCLITFAATLAKARLRSHIHRLQGYRVTRPAYAPKMTRLVADMRNRDQVVSPALRNGNFWESA